MTYQNPNYYFLHAAADAGAAAITPANEDADYPAENLIDYRPSSLFKSTSSANNKVEIDRGAGTLEGINHLIVPDGHSLDASAEGVVESSTTGDFTGEEIELLSFNPASGLISESFTAGSTAERQYQYLRVYFLTTGSNQEYGQLWLTKKRTPSVGPDPNYGEAQVSSTVTIPFPSRSASLSLAANRWQYTLTYHHLDGTDLAVFDELIAEVGIDLLPFYFDPPDDTTPTGPLLMKIIGGSYRREQERESPSGAAGAAYRVSFSMLEQIG